MLRGTDERQVANAYALLFRVLEEELARQGAKEPGTTSLLHIIEANITRASGGPFEQGLCIGY